MFEAVRTIPCVDIAPLVRGARLGSTAVSDDERTAAAELDIAARRAGFFYVTGHDVGDESIDGALDASRRLFALPERVKMTLRAEGGEGVGYEESGAQKLDEGRLGEMLDMGDGVDGESGGDQKESYIAGNMTGNGGKLDAQWPHGLDGFEEAVTRYHADCRSVSAALMRGFAIALGLPPDRFEGDIDDPFTKAMLDFEPTGRFTPTAATREMLLQMSASDVYVVQWPTASKPVEFYRNMLPDVPVVLCHSCNHFFHEEDWELTRWTRLRAPSAASRLRAPMWAPR